ncbi:transposase [Streptococcus pneumoniae]|nr:transposase [Streptococcus pneumoniae]
MGQLHFITKLLDIKDTNIQIIDVVNRDLHYSNTKLEATNNLIKLIKRNAFKSSVEITVNVSVPVIASTFLK